jgi:magnesium-transporting ATPase (P-type)
MKFYYCSKEDTLKYLNSNLEYGLTSDEVRKRVAEYGLNQIQEKARKGMDTKRKESKENA